MTTNLKLLEEIVNNGGISDEDSRFRYPAPIAKTLGFQLIEVGYGTASIKMDTDPVVHGNPMG